VAAEDYERAIKNEEEGCGEAQAAARTNKKAANHLPNSEHGSEDIANSTMDAKGGLFSAI